MSQRLIVFDLDGTLIDSRADLASAINHTRLGYSLEPLPEDVVVSYIGNGARKLVERSFADSGVDVDEALRRYKEYYNAHATVETCCYEGVAAGVERLTDAGISLAVLTNKPGDASRAILRHFGLDRFFNPIIGGGDGVALKPDPAGVLRCMEKSGVTPKNCWMVGDNYTDLEVARNAGVAVVYAAYGFGNPRDFIPDLRVETFTELVNYFL